MKRLLLALLAAAAAGCTSSSVGSPPQRTTLPRFEQAPCEFRDVAAGWPGANGVECGWLHVEETRGGSDGRTLKLWVAIARGNGADVAQDPLLYIHGGPGIATVDSRFPAIADHPTWPLFRASRDIIFFDQRGTGRSEPEFCAELNAAMDAIAIEDPPAQEALQRKVAAFAACRRSLLEQGVNFAAYNSKATADDAEDLRRALGYPAWNVYGVSYGTWPALEIVRTHPDSVRSVILDSPYPTNSPFWPEESIYPTGKAYEALERACDTDPACVARFPRIRETLASVVKRLDAQPIVREGGRITGGAFTAEDSSWGQVCSQQFLIGSFVPVGSLAARDRKLRFVGALGEIHRTSADEARVSALSAFTASPMTSRLRTTASWVLGSRRNSSRVIGYERILAIASRM